MLNYAHTRQSSGLSSVVKDHHLANCPHPFSSSCKMEETMKGKTCTKRIALVTGANKGIGLEICRQLASHGVIILLTSRDEGRGLKAVEMLNNSGFLDVCFHQLDVTDPSSVSSLANFVKTKFGKLDILVNNAGVIGTTVDQDQLALISSQEEIGGSRLFKLLKVANESYENAEECFNTNFYGVKRVTETLIPLLQLSVSPRIVVVSASWGLLKYLPNESLRKEIDNAGEMREERLEQLLRSFLDDLKEGNHEKNGWPTTPSAYKLSKIVVNAYTRMLAKRYPSFCINCVCPGFVKTDINWNTGTITVEEGAQGPVMLALLHDGSASGLFYNQTNVSSFV